MSFCDDFTSASKLHAGLSSNYILDARQLLCQTRSQDHGYLAEAFPNLNAWTVSHSGTGSAVHIAPGSGGTGNPAQNNGAQLTSGATLGAAVWMSRALPSLPKSYGILLLVALPAVSSNMADSLWACFQNTVDNAALVLQFNASGLYVQNAAGTQVQLSTHSNSAGCEWWIEVHDNGDGTQTIATYAGTERVGTAIVVLPPGNSANAGLVQLKQQSGANASQTSQVFQVNIGATQLPDDMIVAWSPIAAPFNATSVNVLACVEDVCNDIVLGTDFKIDVQINNGTFSFLTLAEVTPSPAWGGVIDFTKPVRLFQGVLAATIAQGQNVLLRARLVNGKFGALTGFQMQLTSVY